MMKKLSVLGCLLVAGVLGAASQHVLEVNTKKAGAVVQPTMYGLFFEDINFAADGGLYAEMVKNRSFEFPQALMGWQTMGCVEVKDDGPFERCPHYVVLSDPGHREWRTGLTNEGFFGVAFEKGKSYNFSVWARAPKGASRIRVQLIDEASMDESQVMAEQKLSVESQEWKRYELTLQPRKTVAKGKLRIYLNSANSIALEHVSLFPADTYKGRAGGLRRDLAQALEDAHPGIFRFPGGCIVEGTTLADRYQWKETIGPVENRPLNRNRWEYTFDSRYYPDYFQSYGLGFYEYFQLCEDIKAEPLPVLNVGMVCQYQNENTEKPHVPVAELEPYIQDALDLIEFANGDENTTWGKKRAELGHKEPFNLKYLAIGNEQWQKMYFERLEPFVKAIKAKHPEIKLVGTSGPNSEGKDFEDGWAAMKQLKADLVDEHYYRNEQWFLSHGLRYDSYDRKGPKVFAGEYACHGKGKKFNHYETSILEAAVMTGFERNADVVWMATPAPLFAHVEGWQWRPDLIWYDNLRSFCSVSYYVQQLFAANKGTNVLPLTMNGKPVAGQEGQDGLFASAVTDKNAGTVTIKVVNTSRQAQPVEIALNALKGNHTAKTFTLNHSAMDDENTLEQPTKIVPVEGEVAVTGDKKGAKISDELPPMAFRVYVVK